MINHGLSTGALFLLVGIVYERRHTRMIAEYGGLAKQMPVYATFFLIVALSSIGLPALNGFIGEFTILSARSAALASGASAAPPASSSARPTCSGSTSGSSSARSTTRRTGTQRPEPARAVDADPDLICMVWIGLYPKPIFDIMEKPCNYIVQKVDPEYFQRAGIEYPAPPLTGEPAGAAEHAELAAPEAGK